MFHGIIGTPFDYDQNNLKDLTLWEQLDSSVQYTPTRKFLLAVPILLFLVSTHYSRYGEFTFILNFIATCIVVVAKLPMMHKVRVFEKDLGLKDD